MFKNKYLDLQRSVQIKQATAVNTVPIDGNWCVVRRVTTHAFSNTVYCAAVYTAIWVIDRYISVLSCYPLRSNNDRN
jgi:hypothetical protein